MATHMSYRTPLRLVGTFLISAVTTACTGETPVKESPAPAAAPAAPPASPLRTMTARFAPADIGADLSALPDNERQALAKLVEAARIMDGLFLRQVWSGNDALLDHNKAFVPGVPAKPEGANFYPAGASKEEVQKWIDSLPSAAKPAATGFFTTIRRGPDGHFVAVPY